MKKATSTSKETVLPPDRLQELEACEARADIEAQRNQLLQKRVDELEATLRLEQERGEKHADAFMQISRTCDSRVRDLELQHAAVLAAKDTALAAKDAVVIAKDGIILTKDASIFKLECIVAKLEAEVAALKAQAASKLNDIHNAVTALQKPEIDPANCSQLAAWQRGPVPDLQPLSPSPPLPPHLSGVAVQSLSFDRVWAAAVGTLGTVVQIDAETSAGLDISVEGDGCRTFRSATPLPRPWPAVARMQQRQQQPLPAYRVVIEHYVTLCNLGFIPSRTTDAKGVVRGAITPIANHFIADYGGWYIPVSPSEERAVDDAALRGWVALLPATRGGVAAAAAGEGGCSAYATTDKVPPVPEGSAVEFAVDYAAGTCRVAFYAPEAVASGFAEAPYAKMELRFVATEGSKKQKKKPRVVPTSADSRVDLYPAVGVWHSGAALRFVDAPAGANADL